MKPSSVSRVCGPSSPQSQISLQGSDPRRPRTTPQGEGLKVVEASRPSWPRRRGGRGSRHHNGDGQRRVVTSRITGQAQCAVRMVTWGMRVLQGRHPLLEGHFSHGVGSYASRPCSLRDSPVLSSRGQWELLGTSKQTSYCGESLPRG